MKNLLTDYLRAQPYRFHALSKDSNLLTSHCLNLVNPVMREYLRPGLTQVY